MWRSCGVWHRAKDLACLGPASCLLACKTAPTPGLPSPHPAAKHAPLASAADGSSGAAASTVASCSTCRRVLSPAYAPAGQVRGGARPAARACAAQTTQPHTHLVLLRRSPRACRRASPPAVAPPRQPCGPAGHRSAFVRCWPAQGGCWAGACARTCSWAPSTVDFRRVAMVPAIADWARDNPRRSLRVMAGESMERSMTTPARA